MAFVIISMRTQRFGVVVSEPMLSAQDSMELYDTLREKDPRVVRQWVGDHHLKEVMADRGRVAKQNFMQLRTDPVSDDLLAQIDKNEKESPGSFERSMELMGCLR